MPAASDAILVRSSMRRWDFVLVLILGLVLAIGAGIAAIANKEPLAVLLALAAALCGCLSIAGSRVAAVDRVGCSDGRERVGRLCRLLYGAKSSRGNASGTRGRDPLRGGASALWEERLSQLHACHR